LHDEHDDAVYNISTWKGIYKSQSSSFINSIASDIVWKMVQEFKTPSWFGGITQNMSTEV